MPSGVSICSVSCVWFFDLSVVSFLGVSHVHAAGFAVVPYPSLYPNAKRERREPAVLLSTKICHSAFVVVYP